MEVVAGVGTIYDTGSAFKHDDRAQHFKRFKTIYPLVLDICQIDLQIESEQLTLQLLC